MIGLVFYPKLLLFSKVPDWRPTSGPFWVLFSSPTGRYLCDHTNRRSVEYYDQIFENIDYAGQVLAQTEFEQCTFINCNFEGARFPKTTFMDCVCQNCHFGLADFKGTSLKNVTFEQCKITGVDFSSCQDFMLALTFLGCNLRYSSFGQQKLKKTLFRDCDIQEASFLNVDLTQAIFQNCNLDRTTFSRCVLKGADFSTAYQFVIDPEDNQLEKARFARESLAGLLHKYRLQIV